METHDDTQGRNVRRAIAFVDCCGFTRFTADRGDRAALALYHRLRAGLDEEIAAYPVELVKWMGDGAMLAAEDVNALLTALHSAMLRARDAGSLPIRAGIVVGPVLRTTADGLDYIGSTVNAAARECDAAQPWQVRLRTEDGTLHYTLLPPSGPGARWSPRRPARATTP